MQPLGKVIYTVRSYVGGHGEEFNRWQREEHIPILLGLPGYYAVNRFEQADRPEAFMNVWEVESSEVFDSPKHDAVKTPWRVRMAAVRREHRVDFYKPVENGVILGPSSSRTPSYLTRYDADQAALDALLRLAGELAGEPETCFVRVVRSQKDLKAVLLMHYALASGQRAISDPSAAGVVTTTYNHLVV